MSRQTHKGQSSKSGGKRGYLLVVATVVMLSFGASFIRPAAAGWSDAAIIAAIVLFKNVIVGLLYSVLGGFDSLNQQLTTLQVANTNAQAKGIQNLNDEATRRAEAEAAAKVAVEKAAPKKAVEQWCIEIQAAYVARNLGVFADSMSSYLSQHAYTYMSSDGKTPITSNCFGQTAGHATSAGASAGCQGNARATADRLKIGCLIGALDRYDIGSTQIGGITCDTQVNDAFGVSRSLGTDPKVIFMSSMFLPSGQTPTTVAAVAPSDPGIRQKLFQIQMFYANSLRGNVAQHPIGTQITSSPDAALQANEQDMKESNHRSKEALVLDTISEHAAVPCGNSDPNKYFDAVCKELVVECNNFATLTDVSGFPGCADGSGSLSYDEVNMLWARVCSSPQASVNKATTPKNNLTKTASDVEFCSQWEQNHMANREKMKRDVLSALLGATQ